MLVLAVVAGLFGGWMAIAPKSYGHFAHTVRPTMPDATADPGIPSVLRGTGIILLAVATAVAIAVALR